MLRQIAERLQSAFTRALAAALAAAFAFWAARHLLGHQQPVFAAIAALICLAPGIPSQIRQGMGLIVGVTVGIVVGEFALVIPPELAELRMASATFIAMMVAVSFGMPPVVPIQAGASAMLVLLMGPQVAGLARFSRRAGRCFHRPHRCICVLP
ncbi:FUSC family protein [Agrobacterium sp. SORGH_AS 787]|uniref:FUSC family protein n=1 Tax=Agrobacterium sp. SORGH_AS 787 TaxID=3041775 RepID=UPI00277F1440|nr:uncharacterized membrane protein YgaE (UPF0421/DUF939 family) [Rhizobium sp. SORGH_AS_0787]